MIAECAVKDRIWGIGLSMGMRRIFTGSMERTKSFGEDFDAGEGRKYLCRTRIQKK